MRPVRLLLAVCATALLGAACGAGTTTSSSSAASAPAGASPTAAGGGLAGLPAEEILARASAALQGAKSVRIKGAGGSGSQRFALDVRYSGTGAVGTVGVGGQTVELRKVGQVVYLRGSREFWTGTSGAAAARQLTGKWLRTPLTDKRFAELAEITDLSKAAEGILKPDGKVAKGGTRTINGTEAIGLTTAGQDGVLYIATEGEPYPLRIEGGSGETGGLDFSEYGKPLTVQAPPAAQVVDIGKIGG